GIRRISQSAGGVSPLFARQLEERMDAVSKVRRPESFKQQMRQSMADLRSIIAHGQSVSGDGRFTVRTVHVTQPGNHDARSIRRTREALNLSQALFAQLLGVSPALVRAWELGTRT